MFVKQRASLIRCFKLFFPEPPNCPFLRGRGGVRTPTSRFFESTGANNPNRISIGSAVLIGLTVVTDGQTDRQTDRQNNHTKAAVVAATFIKEEW